VFAAGAYTADGATITLSTGQFSLTAIANQRVLGNVSGGSAKPGALTGAQLAALPPTFTLSRLGPVPADRRRRRGVPADDATWQQITTISGNAGTATKLATARTIAISGAVTGTATGFDGSANITIPITALDVGAATTGVLAVARGGTGVQTSTGTGNNVLSDSPTFTGTITAAAINASGNIFGHDIFASRGDGTGVIYLNNAFTRYLFYDGTNYLLPGAGVSIVSPPAGSAGSLAVHAGWVQNELASYAKAKLVITPLSIDRTLANADNNSLLQLTGAVARTLTAGNIDTGVSIIIANTGTATWAFSCPGGVYLDGSSTTTTSANILAGGRGTAVHLGGGVWLLSGV
jgi:hypothetical protein